MRVVVLILVLFLAKLGVSQCNFQIYPTNVNVDCYTDFADFTIDSVTGGTPNKYVLDGQNYNGSTTTFPNLAVGSHQLIISDVSACSDTIEITVTQLECELPKGNDIVTPNDDKYNDTWFILNIHKYPDNEVFIYTRWGERVYHEKGYVNGEGWDGTYIGKLLPAGTYYYIIDTGEEEKDGSKILVKGAVSLFY